MHVNMVFWQTKTRFLKQIMNYVILLIVVPLM